MRPSPSLSSLSAQLVSCAHTARCGKGRVAWKPPPAAAAAAVMHVPGTDPVTPAMVLASQAWTPVVQSLSSQSVRPSWSLSTLSVQSASWTQAACWPPLFGMA